MAVIRSLNSETGIAVSGRVIMTYFGTSGIVNGDRYLQWLCAPGGLTGLSDNDPFTLPFDGNIKVVNICWCNNPPVTGFYIRMHINGVMQQEVISFNNMEVLDFDVSFSKYDTLAVTAAEVDFAAPNGSYLHVGVIMEES